MKYGGKTRYSHGNPIQNESKSIWITGLCRNLANSIKRNTLAALDSDIVIRVLLCRLWTTGDWSKTTKTQWTNLNSAQAHVTGLKCGKTRWEQVRSGLSFTSAWMRSVVQQTHSKREFHFTPSWKPLRTENSFDDFLQPTPFCAVGIKIALKNSRGLIGPDLFNKVYT